MGAWLLALLVLRVPRDGILYWPKYIHVVARNKDNAFRLSVYLSKVVGYSIRSLGGRTQYLHSEAYAIHPERSSSIGPRKTPTDTYLSS